MTRKLTITAFVLSLLFFIPFAPLVGLILGIVALKKQTPLQGLAIAAIVIGAIMSLFMVPFMLGLILGFSRAQMFV